MNQRQRMIMGVWILTLISVAAFGFDAGETDLRGATLHAVDNEVFVDPKIGDVLGSSSNFLTGAVIGAQEDVAPVIVVLKDEMVEQIAVNNIEDQEKREEVFEEQLEERREDIGDLQEQLLEDVQREIEDEEIIVEKEFETISAVALEVTKEGLEELEENSLVERIILDKEITLLLDDSTPLINANDAHSIILSSQNLTGAGQTICVVDTGVDYTHPALGGCTNETFLAGNCSVVVGGYDVADNDSDPFDENGHGTHVTGIAASRDATYRGVAPGAMIAAAKVFPGSSSSTSLSSVLAGIDWCTTNAAEHNITVISLSLGDNSKHSSHCDDDVLADAVNSAVDAGIFVDVASGNNGYSDGISSPACASKVAAVGRTNKDDSVSSSSNTALILDLLAPGGSITSSAAGGGFTLKSVTSMAAPHVAGAAVLLREYWYMVYNHTLTPSEILARFALTGKDINDTRISTLFPRVDVLASLAPHITFENSSLQDQAVIETSSAFVNITSDLDLAGAVIILALPNGSSTNTTMLNSSTRNYHVTLLDLNGGNYSYQVYGTALFSDDLTATSSQVVGVSNTRSLIINSTVSITINSPSNSSYHNSALILNASVIGTSDLDNSSYSITASNGSVIQASSVLADQINGSSFRWEETVSLLEDDLYTLTMHAIMDAEQVSESVAFYYDTTSPTIISVVPENGTTLGAGIVELGVSVDEQNVVESVLFYATNKTNDLNSTNTTDTTLDVLFTGVEMNASYWNTSLNSSALSGGLTNVTVFIVDAAGNNASSFVTLQIDTASPVISLLAPENNLVYAAGNVTTMTYSAVDGYSEISSCSLYLNDALNQTNSNVSQGVEYAFSVTGDVGLYVWDVRCKDTLHNEGSSEQRVFSVVEETPLVSLLAPEDGVATSNTSVSFSCSATDNLELSSLKLYGSWNEGWHENRSVSVSGSQNDSTFTLELSEGEYVWNCLATDNVGNTSFASTNRTIILDQTSPQISDAAVNPSSASAVITWTTSESANSLVQYNDTQGVDANTSKSDFETSHSIEIDGLSVSSTYSYSITSCDKAGNCAQLTNLSFTTSTESSGDSSGDDSSANAPASSGGGGGGGSGGGGGGAAAAPAKEQEFTTQESEESSSESSANEGGSGSEPEVVGVSEEDQLEVSGEAGEQEENTEPSRNFLSGAAVFGGEVLDNVKGALSLRMLWILSGMSVVAIATVFTVRRVSGNSLGQEPDATTKQARSDSNLQNKLGSQSLKKEVEEEYWGRE